MGRPLVAGDRVADRYQVLREIGKGAMGQVFLARDAKFGQEVALKVAFPRAGANEELFKTRFQREARIGHQLGKTPGFVRALDWGETADGRLYLAMDPIAQAGPLDLEGGSRTERLERVLRAARLIAECHRQGIVHRDIKPSNFLATPDGELYLTDFGLAKLRGEADLPDALAEGAATQTGMAVGTPAYMPPEQFSDAKSADERSDVFALGVMLFRALTGRPPYEGHLSSLLLEHEKVRQGKAVPPRPRAHARDVSKALDDLTARAVAVEPGVRPSAAELADGIEAELRYPHTLVDAGSGRARSTSGRSARPASGRASAVSSRTSSRGVRVDQAVRSYVPAPSRWQRLVARLGKLGLLFALVGLPLLAAAVLLLDLGGVQTHLPEGWQAELGQVTGRIYRRLPPQALDWVDHVPPRITLQGAGEPDWTPTATVTLRTVVREAALNRVSVVGMGASINSLAAPDAPWRSQVELELELPRVGENTFRVQAFDAAGRHASLLHTIWRVDPKALLADCRLERTPKGLVLRGKLDPPLAFELRIGERSVIANADGSLDVALDEPESTRLRVKAVAPRGDEVAVWLVVPPE